MAPCLRYHLVTFMVRNQLKDKKLLQNLAIYKEKADEI
jgi:hypothetical protein